MNRKFPASSKPSSLQQGFVLTLMILAILGIFWLFEPFLPGLSLALLLATATYPIYRQLMHRFSIGSDKAALSMTVLIFFLVVSPLVYLLTASAIKVGEAVQGVRSWFAAFENTDQLAQALEAILHSLPIPQPLREFLLAQAAHRQAELIQEITQWLLFLFKGITSNGFAFLSSLLWVVFSLFFFFRDGPALVRRLRILTPLPNRHDDYLLNRFGALATVLTLSTVAIALIHGLSFALITAFMGLPWFFLGVCLAITSFIPLLGGFIVWGPLAYHLFAIGETGKGVFLTLWGVIVIGFAIDNLLRPMLLHRLSRWREAQHPGENLEALQHTLLTTLSTFGGILHFGILGLFFGPIIAAMAIAVFDVYEKMNQDNLDYS